MKKTLVFSIVWTVLATILIIASWQDSESSKQYPNVLLILSILMPLFGLWFIQWSWRRYKRYQSVRVIHSGGETLFTWTGLDGSEKTSALDPRVKWDEDDRLDDK